MILEEIPASLQRFFDQDPDVLSGKLRVSGTRISVEQVLELIEAGVSPAEIARSFPSLTEQDVAAVDRLAAHYARQALQPM